MKNESNVMLCAPVASDDAAYLFERVAPTLRGLSDDEYANGLALILHTFARWSYILRDNDVFWCSEWEPGLTVVRFSPDGTMAC